MDAKDGYRKCKKKKEKETFMKTLQEIVTHIRSSVELATRFLQKVKTEKVYIDIYIYIYIRRQLKGASLNYKAKKGIISK